MAPRAGSPRPAVSRPPKRPDQTERLIRAIDVIADRLGPEGRPDAPDISTRELQALRILGWAQQLRMSDLATAMKVPLSTATRIVDRLTRKGVVERDGGTDRRTVHVRFSAHGHKLGRCLMDWRRGTAEALLKRLPVRERRALLVALEQMTVSDQQQE